MRFSVIGAANVDIGARCEDYVRNGALSGNLRPGKYV